MPETILVEKQNIELRTPRFLFDFLRPVRHKFARLTLDVFNIFLKLSSQNAIGSRSQLHTTFCVDRSFGPTILRWLSICRLGHCGGPGGRKPLSENGLGNPEAGGLTVRCSRISCCSSGKDAPLRQEVDHDDEYVVSIPFCSSRRLRIPSI